jgi:hypothetical protein
MSNEYPSLEHLGSYYKENIETSYLYMKFWCILMDETSNLV